MIGMKWSNAPIYSYFEITRSSPLVSAFHSQSKCESVDHLVSEVVACRSTNKSRPSAITSSDSFSTESNIFSSRMFRLKLRYSNVESQQKSLNRL